MFDYILTGPTSGGFGGSVHHDVVGGDDINGNALASAELYDPSAGTFAAAGSIAVARELHTATLASNGKVLIAGGDDGSGNALASAELYDPSAGTFTATGSMTVARELHTATLVSNAKVLIVGGDDGSGNAFASASARAPAPETTAMPAPADTKLCQARPAIWVR